MSYITYFDLLGTRGFCDNPETYYKNICLFEKAVKETAWLIKDYGHVGVFSDSAYAESTDLQYLLDFLVQIRNRLISENLFFNAVVKKGEIGASPFDIHDGNVAFGISFKKSDIADLYISQTRYKGIGIFVDPSIYDELAQTGYKMNDCIYVAHRSTNDYSPIEYKDISFINIDYPPKLIEQMIRVILREMYSSYLNAPKFGSYYISLICNIIRSFRTGFDWDLAEHTFTNAPIAYEMVLCMIKDHFTDISDLHGIEFLTLILLDIVYNSGELNDAQKYDITMSFAKLDCMKKYYLHSLNDIPKGLFSFNERRNCNNRDIYINFCKDELSESFVNNILS